MSEKGIFNRVKNVVLLLYTIQKTNEKSALEDNLKVQKLVFLSQKQHISKKMNGFAYLFLRWHKGPFSKDLNNDLVLLRQMKFLRWGDDKIELTGNGKGLLESCNEILEENKNFLSVIDKIIDEYGHFTPDDLKERVYQMKIFVPKDRKIMKIEEIPPKKLMLYGLSDDKTKTRFNIRESWVDTLEVLLDEEAIDLLEQAQKDAKEGNTVDFNLL